MRARHPHVYGDAEDLPDWEALFGSADACLCDHCESVLSPDAAPSSLAADGSVDPSLVDEEQFPPPNPAPPR